MGLVTHPATGRPEDVAAPPTPPRPAPANGLSVTGLCKSFGTTPVLCDLELEVPPGALVAVLGPSGSGKTTLLRTLAGFERPDRGTVRLGARVVDDGEHHVPPEQRGIGYVPQEGSLFPHLTVRQNVGFGLSRRDRQEVDDLLTLVGLEDLDRRHPHQLSGGQQQRVALARALAVRPGIVLFDEPFSSLDASMRESVRGDVRRVLQETGTTAIVVTHDQDEALSFADVVAVIRGGRIAQMGPPRDLYGQPVDAELAGFVGEANLLTGTATGTAAATTVRTALGRLHARWADGTGPAEPGAAEENGSSQSAVTVLVRPEQLELTEPPQPGQWQGQVVDSDYHGHDAVARVRATDALELVVRLPGHRRLEVGTAVSLEVRGTVGIWPSP